MGRVFGVTLVNCPVGMVGVVGALPCWDQGVQMDGVLQVLVAIHFIERVEMPRRALVVEGEEPSPQLVGRLQDVVAQVW